MRRLAGMAFSRKLMDSGVETVLVMIARHEITVELDDFVAESGAECRV
jgi:hypothetical protein